MGKGRHWPPFYAHSENRSRAFVLEEVAKGIKKNRWGDSVLEEAQTRNRNGDSVPEKAEETRNKNKSGITVLK